MADSWNSVQIVTLVVSALTPITVVVLGVLFSKASRRIEQVQWANQTVVTRRLDVFDKLAPGLNQLLCFGTFVGGWKETDPRKAITIKRDLDQIMFATPGADAKVRAPIESKWGNRRDLTWWNDAMSVQFTDDAVGLDEIQAAYDELSQQFRADLYVTRQARPLLATQ